MAINTSMPRYASPTGVGHPADRCGLTDIEYVAALIAQGIVANPKSFSISPEDLAELSVRYAEAVLERAREG